MEYTIREMTVEKYPLLNDFLYEAIFIPDDIAPPPKNIIVSPELQIYVDRFGALKADFALVAEVEEKSLVLSGYALCTTTDILMMKLLLLQSPYTKKYRGQGIGTAPMKKCCLY